MTGKTEVTEKFKTPDEAFAQLEELTQGYMSADERSMLTRAYRFASAAHEGQKRKSGEPFIVHPIEVGVILADLRMDAETVCAALLHDTVEDTDITADVVEEEFGSDVRQLVEAG